MSTSTPHAGQGKPPSPERQPPSTSDVRRHRRIERPPLHVSELGEVRDISWGGLCLAVTRPLEMGQTYSVVITEGTFHYTAELQAEVVWQRGNLAGLRWVGSRSWSGYRAWLRERLSDWQEAPPPPPVREPQVVQELPCRVMDWAELTAMLEQCGDLPVRELERRPPDRQRRQPEQE